MIFSETALSGAYVVDLERIGDERGFFARSFCQQEFNGPWPQCSDGADEYLVQSPRRHDSRHSLPVSSGGRGQAHSMQSRRHPGCHRRSASRIADLSRARVIELTADTRRAVYVPEHFAHGYQVLEPDTETTYFASEF